MLYFSISVAQYLVKINNDIVKKKVKKKSQKKSQKKYIFYKEVAVSAKKKRTKNVSVSVLHFVKRHVR